MGLYFEVIEGADRGKRYDLEEGLSFGRSKGDVILHDPKVSGLHAHIEKDASGNWFIVDDKSSNGVKFEGERLPRIHLKPGIVVQMGRTFLRVLEDLPQVETPEESTAVIASIKTEDIAVSPPPSAPAPVTITAPPPPPAKVSLPPIPKGIPPKKEGDEETFDFGSEEFSIGAPPNKEEPLSELQKILNSAIPNVKDAVRPTAPFSPAILLSFVRGLQVDTQWTLGYGPRKIGRHSVDFPIREPNAPDVCFEILPSPKGPTFRTAHLNYVKLNGKSVPADILKNGDVISIGQSEIEVLFLK